MLSRTQPPSLKTNSLKHFYNENCQKLHIELVQSSYSLTQVRNEMFQNIRNSFWYDSGKAEVLFPEIQHLMDKTRYIALQKIRDIFRNLVQSDLEILTIGNERKSEKNELKKETFEKLKTKMSSAADSNIKSSQNDSLMFEEFDYQLPKNQMNLGPKKTFRNILMSNNDIVEKEVEIISLMSRNDFQNCVRG